jgi:hypothetical protein
VCMRAHGHYAARISYQCQNELQVTNACALFWEQIQQTAAGRAKT